MTQYDDSVIIDKKPTILILLKGENDENQEALFNSGSVLWAGSNGGIFIGKEDEPIWSLAVVIKFQNKKACVKVINYICNAGNLKYRIFSVRPRGKFTLKLIRFLMKKILSKRPFEIDLNNLKPREYIETGNEFLPTKKQVETILKRDDKPFEMLNFLKYKEIADYPADFQGEKGKDDSGATAYGKYSKHAMRMTSKIGGHIPIAGKILGVIFSDEMVTWDDFAVMGWDAPSRIVNIINLGAREGNEDPASIHRDAGLDTTLVMPFDPRI